MKEELKRKRKAHAAELKQLTAEQKEVKVDRGKIYIKFSCRMSMSLKQK